jgi:hypothetical protein
MLSALPTLGRVSDFDAGTEPHDSSVGTNRFDVQRQVCECPSCGRRIYLNREGAFRRHLAAGPDGRRHLCAASGHAPADVVAPGPLGK